MKMIEELRVSYTVNAFALMHGIPIKNVVENIGISLGREIAKKIANSITVKAAPCCLDLTRVDDPRLNTVEYRVAVGVINPKDLERLQMIEREHERIHSLRRQEQLEIDRLRKVEKEFNELKAALKKASYIINADDKQTEV